jgi:hypothetical protein
MVRAGIKGHGAELSKKKTCTEMCADISQADISVRAPHTQTTLASDARKSMQSLENYNGSTTGKQEFELPHWEAGLHPAC